jgi:hypothetical protein
MTGIITEDSRVNVLIRLVGIVLLVLGIVMTILTSQAAAATSIQPEVIPVYYLCSTMLMAAGFIALVAKYRESGTPKIQQ